MKPYLQVEDLTKSYGDRMLFDSITFGVNEGDKIGIIAKNGTGKSTLLRLLSGREAPDSGTVTFRNDLRVGFLDQTPVFEPGTSLMSNLLPALHENDHEEWNREDRVRQMLSQLGINDAGQSVDHLSGGQIKRAALARVLLGAPDLLILDEPTNHLDIPTVEWLENYLSRQRVTLLMVTHDRYFLDRVCNKIIEIDMKQIFTYEGNFDSYLRRRAERIEALTGELAKVKNTLRKEQEWMRRQPQARAGKARYRINAFYDLKERASVRYDERNIDPDEVKSSYIGSKIFEAKGVSKRFGDKVILDDFTYTFARYEKVGSRRERRGEIHVHKDASGDRASGLRRVECGGDRAFRLLFSGGPQSTRGETCDRRYHRYHGGCGDQRHHPLHPHAVSHTLPVLTGRPAEIYLHTQRRGDAPPQSCRGSHHTAQFPHT